MLPDYSLAVNSAIRRYGTARAWAAPRFLKLKIRTTRITGFIKSQKHEQKILMMGMFVLSLGSGPKKVVEDIAS